MKVQIVVLACLLGVSQAANILAFFTMPGTSHWMLAKSYLQELAARGHQVTVVTPYKSESSLKNWNEVIVPNLKHLLGEADVFSFSTVPAFAAMFVLAKFGIDSCDNILNEESVQQLYNSDQKFDVIINEVIFQECFLAFSHKFKAPIIHLFTVEPSAWTADMVGNPTPFAYVPDPFLPYSDHMSYFERLQNAALGTFSRIFRQLYTLPQMDTVVQKRLNDTTIPSVATIERQTALLLINSHVSIGHPKPLVPNYIEVGGMHIRAPKTLPQELQKYIDNANEGLIYFSLGSNVKSADMPEDMRVAFITAFSKLKQNVLWKWETDTQPNQPPNVKISKWLPQSDILAHKKLRLFVTHGGVHSTLEAVHYGVPLIVIPIYGDQKANAQRAVNSGYAVKIDLLNVTAESLQWALSEVLYNPSYRERAQHLSKLFRDRPRPPLEEAVYWTEYIIRHNGAQHLRSAALDLTWCQYLLLDVIAVVLSAITAVLLVVYLLIRTILKRISATKNRKSIKRD